MAKEPVAEIGDEDYWIVRHTHDVDVAAELMRARLFEEHLENGCPRQSTADVLARIVHTCGDECRAAIDVGEPHQVWMRVAPCLPDSYGAAEGWAFQYHQADGPGRGAFPAVVFR